MRLCTAVLIALGLAACGGGGEEQLTVYLRQHPGPEGPPGQIAAVLAPAGRPRRGELAPAVQALVQLAQGPTPAERARGFEAAIPPGTRLTLQRIENGTAFVEVLRGRLDFYGVASVVYSLTELRGVERVRVCCLYRHNGSQIFVHERADFRGWQGEPCEERTAATSGRCLRDR
jgi:sporulation and spore germination protein